MEIMTWSRSSLEYRLIRRRTKILLETPTENTTPCKKDVIEDAEGGSMAMTRDEIITPVRLLLLLPPFHLPNETFFPRC